MRSPSTATSAIWCAWSGVVSASREAGPSSRTGIRNRLSRAPADRSRTKAWKASRSSGTSGLSAVIRCAAHSGRRLAEQPVDVAALQADVAQETVVQAVQLAARLRLALLLGEIGKPARDGSIAGGEEVDQ